MSVVATSPPLLRSPRRPQSTKLSLVKEPTVDPASELLNQLTSRGYRVINSLGQGVYAQAYLADRPDRPGWFYTVKVYLNSSVAGPPNAIANQNSHEVNMLRAIQPLAGAPKPAARHLPVLQEFLVLPGGQEVLVTNYLPGQNLELVIKQYPRLSQSVEWLDQLLQNLLTALAGLESVQVAHRDVKPDNILYDANTNLFSLIDLGLACHYQGCEKLIIAGSLEFLLPEIQILLDYNRHTGVDTGVSYDRYRRGDLYSLGVTVYEIINRRLPYPMLPKTRQGHNVIHDFSRPLACNLASLVDSKVRSSWGHNSTDIDNLVNTLLYSQDNITAAGLLRSWYRR